MKEQRETTDITLFVRTSGDESDRWNRQRIVDALLRETDIDGETAEVISREVEKQIVSSGITRLTTALIREMVDARLVEKGREQDRRLHATLGFPLYDVRQLLLHENKENANVPHSPEGTNLILAEGIKRGYALHDVFSAEICDAHVSGDLHLHGLGYIDRPHTSCHLLEYLKIFGLDMPHAFNIAHPAKHAEVLLAHMVRFSSILQGLFGGLISWEMVNISFAPYLVGLTAKEVTQFAQMLVYEFSQLTSTRGGQALFTDIHLYWDIPEEMSRAPAIGPGGVFTGKTYGDYERESRVFAWAIFEVYRKGDARGRPFIFPRPLVHITERLLTDPEGGEFLRQVCEVAEEKGNPCFVFDRPGEGTEGPGGVLITGNPASPKDSYLSARRASIHNVTINLPRLGYKAEGESDSRLFQLLDDQLDLAVRAHREKREFVKKLLALGGRGPLAVLSMEREGVSYLDLDASHYLVGMVGLDELVRLRGKGGLLEEEGLKFGLKIITYMKKRVEELGGRQGLKVALVQTEAETTAYRFARLDLKMFSPRSGRYIRGDLARGEIYYTNSTCLPAAAAASFFERTRREGEFHPLLLGGATTNLHLGCERISAGDIIRLIKGIYQETLCRQAALSPEFTVCFRCGQTSRGPIDRCPACQGEEVDRIARITCYFSRTSGWNRGKLAELRERNRACGLFP